MWNTFSLPRAPTKNCTHSVLRHSAFRSKLEGKNLKCFVETAKKSIVIALNGAFKATDFMSLSLLLKQLKDAESYKNKSRLSLVSLTIT